MGWAQEAQIGVGVVGAGGAMAGSQMRQAVGARSTRWQGAGGPDSTCWGWWGRRARWQGKWGRRLMAGVVGQEAYGREPDGAGAVGQGGADGQEVGNGRMHEGQWQLLE